MIETIYWGNDPASDSIIITHEDRERLLSDVAEHFRERRGFTIATLNLDHCVKIQNDKDFRHAYKSHSHVVADGRPIVWLSRLAGRNVSLVPGSDLVKPLIALAAQSDVPVALLGSTPDTLKLTADRLRAETRSLKIVAEISPPFGFDPSGTEADRCIKQLRESGARLCLLALGAPKQEIFAENAARILPDCGFVSIGAGLDFIAGSQKRAPLWVQRFAMEWLWRLAGNPSRLARRYGACFAILPQLSLNALRQRFADQKKPT